MITTKTQRQLKFNTSNAKYIFPDKI